MLRLTFILWVILLTWACPAAAQRLDIRSALAVPSTGSSFPADVAVKTVALPDEWARSWPGKTGPVWYRVAFEKPAVGSTELQALYIEQVCSNAAVFLNGQQVGQGGAMNPPLTHNCEHPQLFSLPSALLQPGSNTLDIQVTGHRLAEVGSRQRAGGLSTLVVGPQHELAKMHARQTALNVGLPQATSAMLLLLGGFVFLMGFADRDDSDLAYFGALALGWALMDSRLWLRDLPVSNGVAEFLLCSLMGFMTLAAVQFLLRSVGARWVVADNWLPLQCAVLPLSLIAAGAERLYPMASFWYALMALEVVAAGLYHLARQGTLPALARSSWPVALLLGVVFVAGTMEFMAQWTGTRAWLTHAAQLVLPLVMVLAGLRLIQQHGRSSHSAEHGKTQIDLRVKEATAEIERNFRQMAEHRVEQVTQRERKRIAADLHDDLGAKLLTIVHTSDSERISTLAREALEEMRLSVRGLTGRPVRLADALGDWRAEVISRLAQAGIEGEWSAPEDLQQRFSARAYVQTTRILREAVSNIIKHSGASLCTMRCSITEGDFLLVVQDNGGGIPMELDGRLDRGHGVASMKNRAKQLQGQCLVESGPGYGTVIRLTVPLDRALEAA
jgi:two-component system, NarL family, sensor histidine kinase UhpB